MSEPTANLRAKAAELTAHLPPLLAEAEHLASTVILGEHGRRRAGLGDTFWQYRPAHPGDPSRSVDWRRSARSDATYVQDKEWQLAQTVLFWLDSSASMQFSGASSRGSKSARAQLLLLASAILLVRGGERIGLSGNRLQPGRGEAQINKLAARLDVDSSEDYGTPNLTGVAQHGRAVFISDFLGDLPSVERALGRAAERDVKGVLLQILDPAEEEFPFDGRTIFESMGGELRHETLKAGDLRTRYLDRLAERKQRLRTAARAAGWQYSTHHTDQPAASALLWMNNALERPH